VRRHRPPLLIDRTVTIMNQFVNVGNGSNEAIDKLYAEIDQQREVISLLTTRLNFVLTMFGIEEIPVVFDKQNRSTGCDDADKKSASATDTCYASVVYNGKNCFTNSIFPKCRSVNCVQGKTNARGSLLSMAYKTILVIMTRNMLKSCVKLN